MSLAAYSYAKPLHTASPAPATVARSYSDAARALEALQVESLEAAPRYAQRAALKALECVQAGDHARALFWAQRAEHWHAYSAKLAR